MQLHTHRNLFSFAVLLLFVVAVQAQKPQKIVEQGIAIEFTVEPLGQHANTIRAAEDVNIKNPITKQFDRSSSPAQPGWRCTVRYPFCRPGPYAASRFAAANCLLPPSRRARHEPTNPTCQRPPAHPGSVRSIMNCGRRGI